MASWRRGLGEFCPIPELPSLVAYCYPRWIMTITMMAMMTG